MAENAWARDRYEGPAALRGNSPLPFPLPTRRARTNPPAHRIRQHRTIFISDTHLGTRGCKAEALADFLANNNCRTLYLVGDIIDGWRLKHRWFWPEAHNRVLENPAQDR